eukprot:9645002-Lingulodinium_polyedra.AAC.1
MSSKVHKCSRVPPATADAVPQPVRPCRRREREAPRGRGALSTTVPRAEAPSPAWMTATAPAFPPGAARLVLSRA